MTALLYCVEFVTDPWPSPVCREWKTTRVCASRKPRFRLCRTAKPRGVCAEEVACLNAWLLDVLAA